MEEGMRAAYLQTAVLALLTVLGSGCGNGGYNAENVTVTVSPTTAMVPENGQQPLQATVNHFCSGCTPQIEWSIAENSGLSCTWVDMNTPPLGPCPGGTIQGQGSQGLISPNVIYVAPGSSGTFHVSASQLVSLTEVATGTSVITVSP
jgi:hypothetical protein